MSEAPETKWHARDPSSYSRPDQFAVTHAHIEWRVDFARRQVVGYVDLTMERQPGAELVCQLVLDTRSLTVSEVTDLDSGLPLSYSLQPTECPGLGEPLLIELPAGGGARQAHVRLRYSTAEGASCTALAWLSAEQTAGGCAPFVFSQCQAIHCRSLLPCQDTPAVKFTYTARVHVPPALTPLMSALSRDQLQGVASGGVGGGGDGAVFCFEQPVPIPSYLLALAVGRVDRRELSVRCAVWAEPETVQAAAAEFADTETMLAIAEQLCGPYVWQRYDMLVLPPSFPYGGMENPCMTFLTPTLLAGDRSLADVVAHEICHSWTGNLVTNRNWEHFWLNEGFTTFLERKIRGRMFGPAERHLSATLGWRSLKETVAKLTDGKEAGYTRLVPQLDSVDPDDAFSCVPYEKGHTLLWHLEQLAGGAETFEPFLRAYIDRHRYQTVDSQTFRRFLAEYFSSGAVDGDGVAARLASFDWREWLSGEGMPPHTPVFDTSLTDACTRVCARWSGWQCEGAGAEPCPLTTEELVGYSTTQLIELFGQLLELEPPLSVAKLRVMGRLYNMQDRHNAEVRFRWLRLCVRARHVDMIEECLRFVSQQGRMKFTRPLYRELGAWPEARPRALANYEATKSSMMHVAAVAIAKDLGLAV